MILEKREKFKRLAGYSFIALLFLMLFLGSTVCSNEKQANDFYKSITPDPEAQAEINQMASSFKSWSCELFSEEEWKTFSQEAAEEEFWSRVIDKLKSSTGKETSELLLQVLLTYGGKLEYRENPTSEMTKRMLIFHLSQEIPDQELISLIAPHLEKTTDPILNKNLQQVLAIVALKEKAIPDLVEFDPYLTKHKDTPPSSLIMFMYRIRPKEAAVAMARVYGDSVAADELGYKLRRYYPTSREEDMELLESLSMSNQWWVHLYVADMLRRHPHTRTPEILERLKKDKHPLVSEVLSRF